MRFPPWPRLASLSAVSISLISTCAGVQTNLKVCLHDGVTVDLLGYHPNNIRFVTETSLYDAKEIYVVLQNDYRISRNIRAEWFFKNLNKNLTIKWKTSQDECSNEIEVISAIPKYRENYAVDAETGRSTIKIVPDTRMNFLSTQYRLVFCLDLSSSVATIDVQHDCIYFEEVYSALEQSLKSVCEPFYVPNSRYFFVPQIYITVIAHIPNCPTAVPQVLMQGWILTRSNVRELLDILRKELKAMCKIVADVSASVQEEQVQFMMSHDSAGALLDGTIDGNKMIKKVLDMSADVSSLKLIRCGILALQLLPENSSAGIVVITDGIVNLPNCKALDSLLTQLRNSTIACSFLQLGSPFHPFSSFGRVPYQELMEFISTATCGAYFPASKDILIHSAANEINAYHKALLIWNFQKTTTSYFLEAYEPSPNKNDYWHVENPHFYTVAHQSRVRKKHTEGTLKVSLENLLSCRLREGYAVKNVVFDEGKNLAEVRLVLPWMMSTNIEYLITSAPGRQCSISEIPSCHFEVIVDGCYEFLHDVTCSDKKPIKSIYRKIVIAQFWNYSKNLSNTDQILSQLYSFSHNSVYYTIPESMKNGVPLFYFPTNSSMPVLSSKNVANMQFTSFWKPLCMLDINVWQKWMHVHRIGIILHHDMPLPKNLHLPNSSGRYVPIQCRQAIAILNSLLSEYSSFTLVENHSYIRLLFDEVDRPPVSFFVIRVTSKPPCVVIRLAFLGGLPGLLRCQIVRDLREKILNLKLTKRATSKDSSQLCKQQPLSFPETSCCFFLKKPVEKVLIRYEKLPVNYLVSVPESQFSLRGVPISPKHTDSYLYVDALITLSKYLEQQRWIWTLQYDANTSLALASASKILYTLTNARLQEGFHFAHSSFGIIYLVQEIPMEVPKDGKFEKNSIQNSERHCCVVQYILFPPHTNTTLQDSISDDDENELTEADGELQIITECWVEPQFGKTILNSKSNYLNNLSFPEILSAIHKRDLEINIVLTTLEHLCSLCQKINKTSHQQSALETTIENTTVFPQLPFSVSIPTFLTSQSNSRSAHANTYVIPYCFDLMSLLPKSPQTEIIFSALHEGQYANDFVPNVSNSFVAEKNGAELWHCKLGHSRNHVLSKVGLPTSVKQCTLSFKNDEAVVENGNLNFVLCKLNSIGQYANDFVPNVSNSFVAEKNGAELWHCKLGHSRNHVLSKVGLPTSDIFCKNSVLAKQSANPIEVGNRKREKFSMMTIHSDLCGTLNSPTQAGERQKLDLKSKRMIIIGYFSMRYQLMDPDMHRVIVSRIVRFNENKVYVQDRSNSTDELSKREEKDEEKGKGVPAASPRRSERETSSDVNAEEIGGNDIMFNFLAENQKCFHDQEIQLTLSDCLRFLFQIHHRKRHLVDHPTVPFPHPRIRLPKDSPGLNLFINDADCEVCGELSYYPQELLDEVEKLEVPKWRCFIKGCSPSHIILTLMPATFKDVRKLHHQILPIEPTSTVVENENNAVQTDTHAVSNVAELASDFSRSEDVSTTEICEPVTDCKQIVVPEYHSLHIPVYVYSCSSSLIVDQLVQQKENANIKDHYEKHTFDYETLNYDLNVHPGEIVFLGKLESDSDSPHPRYKDDSDNKIMKQHCSFLDKSFSKAFVYGVYRSLTMGYNVHNFDAVAAIDGICEESLLEIDITEFVYMICGHVKDFTTKNSVRHLHLSNEEDDPTAYDNKTETEKTPEKCLFPLSLLQKHQPCEDLHQKHLNIKEKFSAIIENSFKMIPSRKDYFFFDLGQDDAEETSIKLDGEDSQEEDALLESVVSFEEAGNDVDKISNVCDEETSLKSCLNTESSFSSIDKDTDHDSVHDKLVCPPLFVHFSCSIRSSKQDIKSYPLISLPTCLNDVIQCLDPNTQEINLDDLRITLDITCLTVPSDIENPEIAKQRVYTTSFSSSSPIPEAECYQKDQSSEDDKESNSSDVPSDTLQGGSLQNLPSFQREAVYKCVEKVKWLLQDEKASVALNSYPITSEVLTMVINHVKSSKNNQSCTIKEVPLNFVFGAENSLDKFLQAFKRMSPIGYRLNSINDTYYLVLDPESGKIIRHPFGSLDPPLGIAHKFQMIRQNPHGSDGTELKKLEEDTSVFAGSEYSFLQPKVNNDCLRQAFQTLQTEDSDTDEIDTFRPKMKFHRKISAKRSSCTFHIKRRPHTRLILWNDEKYSLLERPHTAPPDLSPLNFKVYHKDKSSRSIKQNENREYVQSWNNEVSKQFEGTSPSALTGPKDLLSDERLTNKGNPPDNAGSPAICSETECGSFQFSNTEDGYDGDSSDCGSDWDWLSTVDTQRPLLPKFWLIMNVCNNKVLFYFHMRERNDLDEELICCKEILNEVVAIIENICKEVNQVLLLQNLYETRMCNRLLVPEGSEDLWKDKDLSFHPAIIGEDPDFEVQDKYLEATLKLEPGAFDCPVVWVTHFKLHHRLISCPQGNMKSYGLQALRSVLNTFSVNNRENMFVYQEESGSVFYLRLFEEICEENHSSCISKHEDNLSLMGSCCSSLQSLPQRKNYNESETEIDFRPRVNSGASDGYRQDSLSTTSRRLQKCVALNVHGIGEVGTAIKTDLVQVLQNRLNDGILDIIITMLARNPLCMLTPEDVQFIQNPNSAPTHEMHFTLPVKLLGYAHSVHIYLRQNLLQFLYNPKYTDIRRENHFKAYSHSPIEWSQVDDNDIFLYHCQPASGLLGGKGISCIVLSLVTGQGAPYQTLNNLPPDPSAYQDALSESEFEDLTSTVLYAPKKEKCPGPVALIRFQIWSVGKDAKELIENRLASAVRHALWDILMEYHALTCPISDFSYLDDSSCYSEPTTPIKVRRAGTAGIDANLQSKDFHPSTSFQTSKEMSSSVPDISTKVHSPPSMLKEISIFKFGNGPQSAKPEFYTETSTPMTSVSPKSPKIDKQSLNSAFHTIMKPLLHFGDRLGCPALLKHTYVLPSRHSIVIVSKEIQNIIKTVLRDIFPKVYVQASSGANADYEYIPFSPYANAGGEIEESKPGTVKNFIIIGRNEKQWKAYMGQGDFLKFQEINNESLRTYQKYQTHVCCRRSSETFTDSLPSSPTSFSKSHNSLVSSSFKTQSMNASDPPIKPAMNFVPRQRLFLIYVDDKKITLFLYNWSQDITQTLIQQLTSLVKWHEQRNSFINNILLQKLGLFYGLSTLSRTSVDKSGKEEKSKVSREIRESLDDSLTSALSYMEQLIHSHNYTKESHSSSASSRSSSISVKPTYIMRNLKNLRPPVPFHLSSSANIKDPVTAHGSQFLETITTQRRGVYMQVLNQMWKSRGSSVYYPFERVFHELKRLARLSHYCLTPLLFSPSWRWKVAPIRDHALEPLEQTMPVTEKPAESGIFSRSRHSSGSSIKNSDTSNSSGSSTSSRVRRMSGAFPGSNQSSPKLRAKTPSEETWHNTVCRHYLQEYVQYLHTIGFISLRTEPSSQSKKSVGNDDDKLSRSDSFSLHKHNIRGQQVFYLIKSLLGGLLVFEIGLADPYAYGHLYSIECSRFNNSCNLRTLNSQFAAAFLDELDKVKLLMHLHSFTYDYHLRTIHSYISGRQLIFRHGYHLTSFLDDFIKYYQKVPTGARNLLYAGTLTIPDINMSGSHLYNYIISHNMLYGMTVLRMVPVMVDSSSNIDTEFALIELSAQKASYKDFNDICQMGNFDVGLLINHNTSELTADPNSLVLNYYIILTSQRDLYPKLSNFGATLGSFQTVRFGSMQSFNQYSSRKTRLGAVMTEKEKFESSGEESVNSNDSRSKKSVIRGMCDEDVTYLGYYSSQETMMQKVLSQRAEVAQKHLKGVVHRASIHCRRDSLWSTLLPRSLKDDNSSKDYSSLSTSSYADFAELLDLVTVMPLNDFDDKLSPFMNMHISWYVTLAPVLKTKYVDTHREYISPDGNSIYVVVTDAQCPDSFLLLTIDAHMNRTELGLVFREFSADVEHNDDKPNQKTAALHSLVEGFVNACSFHLWTCML
ncbi:LOW QUALITY PROTEIN: KICSTOR complex protein SZT2-like [Uloborus diversus]|uniref:LOW QUALITY PROTEIN: KICSTOR complex protein SZT2-like n=1 Tax=Uloborus diversus TaxID=327109 RepID=UPI0024093EA5|nr:LOW QUALITY PROTEIN: KICSTOR complex protein SZT2-like [Uloborus diversus]